ncbi:hypothetical protein ACFL3V_07040 [Nanoarchaeota archaeon]
MVEVNSTLFPLLGPIGTAINFLKVLIGGVFGLYLVMLYLRWREYMLVKHMLTLIRKDIRQLAEKQKVTLDPITEPKIITLGKTVKRWFTKEKTETKSTAKRK